MQPSNPRMQPSALRAAADTRVRLATIICYWLRSVPRTRGLKSENLAVRFSSGFLARG